MEKYVRPGPGGSEAGAERQGATDGGVFGWQQAKQVMPNINVNQFHGAKTVPVVAKRKRSVQAPVRMADTW